MPLEITMDNVVVGSSLEALLFAFYGKYKVLYTRLSRPDTLEKLEEFGLGISKQQAWDKHIFQLELSGYIPFNDKISHIKYIDSETLKIITNEEGIYYVKYKKIFIFDDHQIDNLPPHTSSTSNKIKLIDWFHVERGDHHKYDYIKNNSDFMNEVIFFKSSKRKSSQRKDVCVVSYCDKETIQKYPEHLLKIKTESYMKELGIVKTNKSSIKLNHIKRDIIEYGQNVYENFDNCEFVYDDCKTIYELNQGRHKIDYMKYLRLKMGI